MSKVAEQDTKVTFKIDADALTAYNAANGTNYTAYEGATLSNNGEVTIPAGKEYQTISMLTFLQVNRVMQ